MIIDSIVLANFGVYCGRQEALLTPEEGKPVILLGGMNGGGKTTFLDAIQLGLYGSKARLSNRGKLPYKDYLRESINRHVDPVEGAGITISFRRITEGQTRKFELRRYWREAAKGIEETVTILCDGVLEDSQHWDETMEAYLPSSISHLFFFDGEQIASLAEGGHTAEIIGTAVHSLLGLNLVNRLENDLKIFERRKKGEGLDPELARQLAQARTELEQLDQLEDQAAMDEGALRNEVEQVEKDLVRKEETFKAEGGELFLRRNELQSAYAELKAKKAAVENRLREVAAGPLPLLLVADQLAMVEQCVRNEAEVKRARVILDVLQTRDTEVLESLKALKVAEKPLREVAKALETDRLERAALAKTELVLECDDALAPQIAHLREVVLPSAADHARVLMEQISVLDEQLVTTEGELVRVPPAERIAQLQQDLTSFQAMRQKKAGDLEAVRVRRQALQRQRLQAEARLDKFGTENIEAEFSEDARQRMLKHSHRVRETLSRFRTAVTARHTEKIQGLMLESFRKLLRKDNLIANLAIDPETFEATLTTRENKALPFDRLSAGEKQLLATALLWGLARASGRPVPTVIDTPLGRLDSSHRNHLVQRYFPHSSHQVILLSTDEEIIGPYLQSLKPYITRCYLLDYDAEKEMTAIRKGYFEG